MTPDGIIASFLYFVTNFFHLLYCYGELLYRMFVPPSMKSINGETILVTGAVGGIGKEICRQILRSSSSVKLILWDLDKSSLDEFASELRRSGSGQGHQIYSFPIDISSRENIDECCRHIKEFVGPVTIIFNNAGIAPPGNFLQLSNEQIQKTIEVNLNSHFWIIRQFLPEMIARNHGRIINMCSMGGLLAAWHSFPYFASKFAVNGYTEALRLEMDLLGYKGIQITTVYPFFVKTPLIGSLEYRNTAPSIGLFTPSAFKTFMEPDYVARNVVDGMRREYENIYLPGSIPFWIVIHSLLPLKFKKRFQASVCGSYAYSDKKEQERLQGSFIKPEMNGIFQRRSLSE